MGWASRVKKNHVTGCKIRQLGVVDRMKIKEV